MPTHRSTPGAAAGRRQARPPTVRAPLSRERIAVAALALIDRDGLDACSMRRLGSELGVEAMALYHHFASKGRLLDAVMDLLVREIELPPAGQAAPIERLRTALRSYRGIALRHPQAFPLLVGRRFNSDGAFAVYEQLLQMFAACGLDAQQAARWFRTVGYFASGAGMADIASREQEPDATPLTLERAPRHLRFPHVAAAAPHLRVERLDEVFEFGLSVLLDALARSAPSPSQRKRASAAQAPSGTPPSCAR